MDLGRLEGVVGGEVDVEEEDAAGVGGVVGAHDGGLPVEHVVSDRSGAAVGRRVLAEVDQFLIDPLEGHGLLLILLLAYYLGLSSDEMAEREMICAKKTRAVLEVARK